MALFASMLCAQGTAQGTTASLDLITPKEAKALLASPYGRAEDANLAFQYRYSNDALFRIGYRVLEGGSDGGGNVYTFAAFHFITAGITVTF